MNDGSLFIQTKKITKLFSHECQLKRDDLSHCLMFERPKISCYSYLNMEMKKREAQGVLKNKTGNYKINFLDKSSCFIQQSLRHCTTTFAICIISTFE